MPSRFASGDAVQTPFGKGIVREVRNKGDVLVEIGQRALVVPESALVPIPQAREARRPRPARAAAPSSARDDSDHGSAAREVDLHGLTVEEALIRIDEALNDALLASLPELRFIHGRTGGRLRGALHQRLRAITTVRGFRVDPRNAGVTIVSF